MEHNQVPVRYEDKTVFSVDEKLQSLIQFLFDNGYETFNSCEDNVEDTTWIQFGLDHWKLINEIAFRSRPHDLYDFIEEQCFVELRSGDDGHPDEADEYWIEGSSIYWTASVRFPKENLELFEQLIRTTLTGPNMPA